MSYRPSGQSTGFGQGINPPQPEVFSLIDRHSTVEGTFTSSRDLRIEGQMSGTLRCQGLLYIAESAEIDAAIEASNITVAGRLRGNVTCHGKLQIMPTGRVYATVTTDTLVINEGAIYEGELRMEPGAALPLAGSQPEMPPAEGPTVLRRFGPEGDEEAPPAARRREE